jgi:pimeloyl-ACP methyl ester carboxylesterase
MTGNVREPGTFDAIDPGPNCPISWHPNALSPVFWGARDYQIEPTIRDPLQRALRLRVFFPSLDGTPFSAAVLRGCGKYPLILFAHGNCQNDGDANHYKRWLELPQELARGGAVVVVPDLPGVRRGERPGFENDDLVTISNALEWMHNKWDERDVLLPPEATGIIGHSYGGMLAAVFALSGRVAAYASLSAGWLNDWLTGPPFPIQSLSIPKLLIWGAGSDDAALTDDVWDSLLSPKHRVVFSHGNHWDYLPPATVSYCGTGGIGVCPDLRFAAFDFVTMFFAKYLQPEFASQIPPRIPSSLQPPPLVLTQDQKSYAGLYLIGVDLINAQPGCEYKLDWVTPIDRIVPPVVNDLAQDAETTLRSEDLVPVFSGTGSVVGSQSPGPGERVDAGTTVHMHLKNLTSP